MQSFILRESVRGNAFGFDYLIVRICLEYALESGISWKGRSLSNSGWGIEDLRVLTWKLIYPDSIRKYDIFLTERPVGHIPGLIRAGGLLRISWRIQQRKMVADLMLSQNFFPGVTSKRVFSDPTRRPACASSYLETGDKVVDHNRPGDSKSPLHTIVGLGWNLMRVFSRFVELTCSTIRGFSVFSSCF